MGIGYLTEYSKKDILFGQFMDKEKLICSREALARLLRDDLCGTVWSAKWIDVEEYRRNHEGEELRTLE